MIFSDTSFLVAAMDDRDSRHNDALKLLRRFGGPANRDHQSDSRRDLDLASMQALAPQGGRIPRQHRRDNQHIQVSRIERSEEGEALHWLRRHDEREYSFVDATSFAFMRAKGIEEALAFGGDFVAAGFVELRP